MNRPHAAPTIVVAGAGGFIGGHIVADLRKRHQGQVRAVDIKPLQQWHQRFDDVENIVADLSSLAHCREVCRGAGDVYNFAADMGGMGFIENNKALCMLSVLINTHLLMASREAGIKRYFFASSACVYNAQKQTSPDVTPLCESDAYPALPEDGYGWEKLFSERMCRHFYEDFGLGCRIARFHNIYGPHGTWQGGREKAPAAICRKVIEALDNSQPSIEVWGDGTRTRSFTYIHDCVEGVRRLMESDVTTPLNVGSNELVTINELVETVESIAGVTLQRDYKLDAPAGVNGRNSDNSLIQQELGWQPHTSVANRALQATYTWIRSEYEKQLSRTLRANTGNTQQRQRHTPQPDKRVSSGPSASGARNGTNTGAKK